MSLLRPHRGDKHKGPKNKKLLTPAQRKANKARAQAAWYRANPGCRREYNKAYWAANKDSIKERRNEERASGKAKVIEG